jgi:hypothetical protein
MQLVEMPEGKGKYFYIGNPDYLNIGPFGFNEGRAVFPFGDLTTISLHRINSNEGEYARLLEILTGIFGPPGKRDKNPVWQGRYLEYELTYDIAGSIIGLNILSVSQGHQ